MPDSDEVGERASELQAWARVTWDVEATVSGVVRLNGHAGETWAFDVTTDALEKHCLVVRLAPPGVARRGNTDVLRQGPLLDALRQTPVPVAEVVGLVDDPVWFGTDALVQQRIDGVPLSMFPPVQAPPVGSARRCVRAAAYTLAALHEVDHTAVLPDWEPELSAAQTLDRWIPLISRMPEDAWIPPAQRLAEVLARTCPTATRIGICHGDYQTNNVLYHRESGDLVGIVDWELAGIGPTGLDVGWLAMMTDRTCWGPELRDQLLVAVEPLEVRRWYDEAAGRPVSDFDWFFALACFRYAVIAAYNVRLHRTGRRIDPFNELMAGTVPVLLDRGLAVLQH